MGRTVLVVLGNGFTLDFLQNVACIEDEIDVTNLFRNGDQVPWHNEKGVGYLSHKHCKMLWSLGIRPTLDASSAKDYFEQILTCANFYFTDGNRPQESEKNNLYLGAYLELVRYLKSLFIHYDALIKVDSKDIINRVRRWTWYRLISSFYQNADIKKIVIVTYNYDIFLERMLDANSIPYYIKPFPTSQNNHRADSKITIYKPHGSISFSHKNKTEGNVFPDSSKYPITQVSIKDFEISTNRRDMNATDSFIAIVPPSGDSLRLNFSWADETQKAVLNQVESLGDNTSVIINGLSYWHVDRFELDKILLKLSPSVRDVVYVDPNPSSVLTAVLSSRFENFKVLRRICKGVID